VTIPPSAARGHRDGAARPRLSGGHARSGAYVDLIFEATPELSSCCSMPLPKSGGGTAGGPRSAAQGAVVHARGPAQGGHTIGHRREHRNSAGSQAASARARRRWLRSDPGGRRRLRGLRVSRYIRRIHGSLVPRRWSSPATAVRRALVPLGGPHRPYPSQFSPAASGSSPQSQGWGREERYRAVNRCARFLGPAVPRGGSLAVGASRSRCQMSTGPSRSVQAALTVACETSSARARARKPGPRALLSKSAGRSVSIAPGVAASRAADLPGHAIPVSASG